MNLQGKGSFAYFIRNFLQLICCTLPVSILLAFVYNPTKETLLFAKLVSGQLTDENYLAEFSEAISVLRLGNTWWLALVCLALLALAMSLVVAKIDSHMRAGRMLILPYKRTFGVFPNMLLYIGGWVVASEVSMLLTVGITHMLIFIRSVTAIISIGLTLVFLVRVFLAYIFGLLLISFPLSYSEDYRYNIALSYSVRAMVHKKRIVAIFAFSYPLARIAVMALGYVIRPAEALVYMIAMALALAYIPCLAYTEYYDEIGGERRDVPRSTFS